MKERLLTSGVELSAPFGVRITWYIWLISFSQILLR